MSDGLEEISVATIDAVLSVLPSSTTNNSKSNCSSEKNLAISSRDSVTLRCSLKQGIINEIEVLVIVISSRFIQFKYSMER